MRQNNLKPTIVKTEDAQYKLPYGFISGKTRAVAVLFSDKDVAYIFGRGIYYDSPQPYLKMDNGGNVSFKECFFVEENLFNANVNDTLIKVSDVDIETFRRWINGENVVKKVSKYRPVS